MMYSIIIVPIAADAGRNTGGEHALIQMAEDTGGKYYYVEDPKDLEPAFTASVGRSEDAVSAGVLCAAAQGWMIRSGRLGCKMKDRGLQREYELRYRSGILRGRAVRLGVSCSSLLDA